MVTIVHCPSYPMVSLRNIGTTAIKATSAGQTWRVGFNWVNFESVKNVRFWQILNYSSSLPFSKYLTVKATQGCETVKLNLFKIYTLTKSNQVFKKCTWVSIHRNISESIWDCLWFPQSIFDWLPIWIPDHRKTRMPRPENKNVKTNQKTVNWFLISFEFSNLDFLSKSCSKKVTSILSLTNLLQFIIWKTSKGNNNSAKRFPTI